MPKKRKAAYLVTHMKQQVAAKPNDKAIGGNLVAHENLYE